MRIWEVITRMKIRLPIRIITAFNSHYSRLLPDVRQKRQKPRALHRLGELALVLGTNAGVLRVNYLRLARNETPQEPDLLVVDFVQILGAEETLLGHIGGITKYEL